MDVTAYMMSCSERDEVRARTLDDLRRSDWQNDVIVQIDRSRQTRKQSRVEETAFLLLRHALEAGASFVLFLEDDLEFNRHLRHNLAEWVPLRAATPSGHFFGSLYNPCIRSIIEEPDAAYFLADPDAVYGSQALLMSRSTIEYVLDNWADVPGMPDIKMSRLAARNGPLFFHVPSLVQHVGVQSTWGGSPHVAPDYQRDWRA